MIQPFLFLFLLLTILRNCNCTIASNDSWSNVTLIDSSSASTSSCLLWPHLWHDDDKSSNSRQLAVGSMIVSSRDPIRHRFELIERIHIIGQYSDEDMRLMKQLAHASPAAANQMTPWIRGSPDLSVSMLPMTRLPLTDIMNREASYLMEYSESHDHAHHSTFELPTGSSHEHRHARHFSAHEYLLRSRLGRGHFGEVWRARRLNEDSSTTYVLKRLFVERGMPTRLSGRREVHFGLLLRQIDGIARLEDWFEDESALWLIFRDEGVSLDAWSSVTDEHGAVTRSDKWRKMRLAMTHREVHEDGPSLTEEHKVMVTTTSRNSGDGDFYGIDMYLSADGPFLPSPPPSTVSLRESPDNKHVDSSLTTTVDSPTLPSTPPNFSPPLEIDSFKSILYQLLSALAELHSRGVTHRDVKPQNILLREHADIATAHSQMTLRLCDFGSAVSDDVTLNERLYPPPYSASLLDNTLAYSPPEVLFSSLAYDSQYPHAYDSWSVGIVALELILGGREFIWAIDARVKARIERKVEEAFENEVRMRTGTSGTDTQRTHQQDEEELKQRKEKAVLFRALIEYGVYESTSESEFTCNDNDFQSLLKQHDPLGLGVTDLALVQLLRSLLQWHPSRRLTASAALQHEYFLGPSSQQQRHSTGDHPLDARFTE